MSDVSIVELGLTPKDMGIKEQKTDIDLPKTDSITKEEFDKRAERSLENGHNTFATPILSSNSANQERMVDLAYNSGTVEIGIDIPAEVASQLTEEQRNKLGVKIEGGRVEYIDKGSDESSKDQESGERQQAPDLKFGPPQTYFIGGEKPRGIQADEEQIKRESVDEVADVINQTPGEGLIFYTGAGISKGGEKPIWGMPELNSEMHVDQGTVIFLQELAEHPQELAGKFREFNQLFYEDVSTPAHIAIADIVKAKPGSIVFTENFDLKHEASGSRIAPIHMGNLQSHEDLLVRAKAAKVLITVGLSHDDRAAIGVLKKENPDLKIIAFSLPPNDKVGLPNFLAENDPNDAVVLGDCQELLPQVASKIKQL